MSEKQRQDQKPKNKHSNDDAPDEGGLSEQAQETVGQLASVDTMIDDILSSATTGNYLESIRQRGGQ